MHQFYIIDEKRMHHTYFGISAISLNILFIPETCTSNHHYFRRSSIHHILFRVLLHQLLH